jgi:hypothetical protein
MSTEETSTAQPLHDGRWVGVICFCLIIGGIAVFVSLNPPDTVGSTPFAPVTNTDKCGEGTFYHPMTNKCETFRPLQSFETVENAEMIADLEKTIRDIHIDLDGNRIVERDAEGLPVVSCSPYENEQYSIDEKCKMTLK